MHGHKKLKDILVGSMDQLSFAADVEFQILYVNSLLEHWYIF